MKKFYIVPATAIIILLFFLSLGGNSQSLVVKKDFSLGSPYNEPDGRNDIVKISETDFITLAKAKGSQTGKSDFVMQRLNAGLETIWQAALSADASEDYKDLFFNGSELILLSVIHNETEKKTKMEAYGFDINTGTRKWTKELESYQVGDWETHLHKGKVKESFVDVICEHTNKNFTTPFEYKHNVKFSPDQQKFVSYVFNYGEKNLTATLSVYDNNCNLINRGVVAIDNDYVNHGIFIDNGGMAYILNVTSIGKVNMIQYDLASKDFQILEIPATNYQKDNFQVQFINDLVYVANSEIAQEKTMGVKYYSFNFKNKSVDETIYEDFDAEFKSKVNTARKGSKLMRGEEDWKDYEITNFIVDADEKVFIILEKRSLYAEGYPHIKEEAFDKSHYVEISGHVHAEGILLLAFSKDGDSMWKDYLVKSQVYPANDGLNTISYSLDQSKPGTLRILYAGSENTEAIVTNIYALEFNKETGARSQVKSLPNGDKLILVRDYTLWMDDSIVLVGKKGLLGKTSEIVKFKL